MSAIGSLRCTLNAGRQCPGIRTDRVTDTGAKVLSQLKLRTGTAETAGPASWSWRPICAVAIRSSAHIWAALCVSGGAICFTYPPAGHLRQTRTHEVGQNSARDHCSAHVDSHHELLRAPVLNTRRSPLSPGCIITVQCAPGHRVLGWTCILISASRHRWRDERAPLILHLQQERTADLHEKFTAPHSFLTTTDSRRTA